MDFIYRQIFYVAEIFSILIGTIGISIIFFGTLKGLWSQLSSKKYSFENARFMLSRYLILGLDFLVAKDIIDTILLDTHKAGQEAWLDLARLITVVTIRIVLNHFLEKELKELKEMKTLGKRFQKQIISKSKKNKK